MKRHFYFALVGTLVSVVWLFSLAAFAQAPPSGDSYVASSTPTTNYGPSTILPLQTGVRTYIRFDLSGIPANATVQKAVIRLFLDGFTAPGSFDVYRINSVWDENTLTWSNKPVLGASATGNNPVPIAAVNLRNFVLVDITPLVKNWVNGTVPNNGIALALTTTAGSFSFDSKENTNVSHEPALEIAIPGAAGATGPQGPQGPQGQTGAIGPRGPLGPVGPQGPQGTAGQNGTNGVSFIFRNAFDNSASYATNDVVTYSGSSYIAIAANHGPSNPTPDTNPTAWSLMAQKGATGPQGTQGAQGSQGQTGATGATGPQGPQGIPGDMNPGSPYYIQNGTTLQTSSNFNVSGNGTAGGTLTAAAAVNTSGVYQISGRTALSALFDGNENTFVGQSAGPGTSTVLGRNTFVGYGTGSATTSGQVNTFVGHTAGHSNTTGIHNVYVGADAGYSQTTGIENVAVGASSGVAITTGNGNSLVGFNSGLNLTTGGNNLLLGSGSGGSISTGSSNILLLNPGQNDESNTIRIGTSGNGVGQQSTVYIAGVNSQTIASGSPVWVDANGMLGIGPGSTGGGVTSFNTRTGAVISQAGDYDFSQLTGQVGGTQLVGSYPSALTNPLAGSANYLQNATAQQTGANFNIDGNGTVGGTLSATTAVNSGGTYQISGTTVLSTPSTFNVFVGPNAGRSTTGTGNTLMGTNAGQGGNGDFNSIVGHAASQAGNTGTQNSIFGAFAGAQLISASYNILMGWSAGSTLQTGNSNVLIGSPGGSASESNTIRIGTNGTGAGRQNQTFIAGIDGATVSSGVPVYIDSTGKLGTVGGSSGGGVMSFNGRMGAVVPAANDYSFSLLSGTLADGQLSGTYSNALNFSNAGNTFTGNGAGLTNVTASALATGTYSNALNFSNAGNTFTGNGAGLTNVTASALATGTYGNALTFSNTGNSFTGSGAGLTNVTASALATGTYGNALTFSNTGNSFTGSGAGLTNVTASVLATGTYSNALTFPNTSNSFTGANFNSTGTYQIGGRDALQASLRNLAVGLDTGPVSSAGDFNTYVGAFAGSEFVNNSSSDNTMIGYEAGFLNTGTDNTYVGYRAGGSINGTSGTNNSTFGSRAGSNLTSGNHNLFIGYDAGSQITTGTDNLYIYSQIDSDSSSESHTIRIGIGGGGGFQQNRAFIAGIAGATSSGGVNVLINSSGQLGTTTSSRRFKDTILEMGDASSKLFQLRPVTFFYKPQFDDGSHILQYGLIAEEVAKIYPGLVVFGEDGQPQTVRYHLLTPMLLNELQKQHKIVNEQQNVIQAQQQQSRNQEEQIGVLQQTTQLQQERIATQAERIASQGRVIEEIQQRLSRLETLMSPQMQAVAQK